MTIRFRSIRSSSKGNCLLMVTEDTRLLIDCGLGSMKNTTSLLTRNLGSADAADAVIFTHMHSDHCSYYPLRVLSKSSMKLMVHQACVPALREKHCSNGLFDKLNLQTFSDRTFQLAKLHIEPFEVRHQPEYRTCGFSIGYRTAGCWKKLVIASDLNDGRALTDRFADADFIYIESNHDLELLRLRPNPNSRFHMSNPATAAMLCETRQKSRVVPQAVMLGHLSDQRNEADIAIGQIYQTFLDRSVELDFPIVAAARYTESATITIT